VVQRKYVLPEDLPKAAEALKVTYDNGPNAKVSDMTLIDEAKKQVAVAIGEIRAGPADEDQPQAPPADICPPEAVRVRRGEAHHAHRRHQVGVLEHQRRRVRGEGSTPTWVRRSADADPEPAFS